MLFPEELFIKEILPNLRIVLTKKLEMKGYSQSKIAKIIGVTQARVNSYTKEDLNKALSKLEEIGFNVDELKLLLDSILDEGIIDQVYILRILRNYFISALVSGQLCKYHIKIANLPPNCDVCLKYKEPDFGERQKMVRELKEAAERLLSVKEFYFLIPEVYTNLAYTTKNPESLKDVLSFPGRIIKFKNEAKIISDPEFGASKHIASMLLEANKANPEIRACLCIKYDKRILKLLKEKKIDFAFNNAKKKIENDPVVEAFKNFLSKNKLPQVLIDKGGKNLEPVCYIFGKNPTEVVNIAIDLSKSYFEKMIS